VLQRGVLLPTFRSPNDGFEPGRMPEGIINR
jgi:hypothetical protein